MPDIMIGYVHTGSVHERFMRSLFNALSEDQGKHLQTFIAGAPANIAESRCNVVQQFLESDAEWLWFIDTDVVFPPNTHLRLLEAADPVERPIVTAAYWTDYAEGRWLVWQVWREDRLCPVSEMPEEGVVRLAACGLGCLLIHRSVLEKIAAEYADDPWPWFGHDVIKTPDGNKRLGEDFTFCVRALKVGAPIHGLSFPVEHRKVCTLGVPDRELVEA